MQSTTRNPFRHGLGLALLAAGAAIWALPAGAQAPTSGAQSASPPLTAAQAAHRENPGEALSRHLRALSEEPKSVGALMGAGQAALELGDANAAITFFARAEEITPRDARIKAGYGSAFVKLEQPQSAIKFFNEAVRSGIAESAIAADRGLAYDMIGDSRRAQRDYQLALRSGADEEVERRLALSLAISGDRDAALTVIDGQLRRQERAAWRTRAFILALNGDTAGATSTAASVIPAQAESLRPFFAQLSHLNPAQKAMAVHFGRFPEDGKPVQMAQNFSTAPNAVPQAATPQAAPPATTARRRPGQDAAPRSRPPSRATPAVERDEGRTTNRAERVGSRIPTSTTDLDGEPATAPSTTPATAPSAQSAAAGTATPPAPQTAPQATPPASTGRWGTSAPAPSPAIGPQLTPAPGASSPAPAQPPAVSGSGVGPPAPASSAVSGSAAPSSAQASLVQPDAAPGFASIASIVAGLGGEPAASPAPATPDPAAARAEEEARKAAELTKAEDARKAAEAKKEAEAKKAAEAKKEAEAKKAADAKAAAEKKKAAEAAKKPKEPSRIWVQVAGGANKRDLPAAYAKLKAEAPAMFKDKTPWTTPLRATNRLLVGPFKTQAEAQSFVNALAREKLSGFSWTSPDGQEIEKLPAK